MPAKRATLLTKEMDLRAGFAPASAVYETAASLPMLAESEMAAGAQLARAFTVSETAVLLLDDPAMAES